MKKSTTKLPKTVDVTMRNITCTVTSSYEDYFKTVGEYYASFSLSKRRKTLYRLYFLILGVFALYSSVADLLHTFNFVDIYGICLGLLFLTPWVYIQKVYAFLSYNLSRLCNPTVYSINDKRLMYKSGKFSTKKVAWSSFNTFVITNDVILCARLFALFPMVNLISFIPKRFVKEDDWKELVQYVKYRKEMLDTIEMPNRFKRWGIRILFIILIELCLWIGYVDSLVFFNVNSREAPFAVPLILLMIYIPFYSKLIDFKVHSFKTNVLFPIIAFIVLVLLVTILFILVP